MDIHTLEHIYWMSSTAKPTWAKVKIYLYLYMYIYVYIRMYVHIYSQTHTHMHVYTHSHVCGCTYLWIYLLDACSCTWMWHINTLQHVAYQYTATHCNTCVSDTRVLLVWHINTLKRTASHYNALQHMCEWHACVGCVAYQHIETHCFTLQCTATHCNAWVYGTRALDMAYVWVTRHFASYTSESCVISLIHVLKSWVIWRIRVFMW